jgi:phenylacetate-CoA ligase
MRTLDRLSRSDLVALQQRKLGSLLDRLRTNPFYAERLASLPSGGRPLDLLRGIEPVDKQQLLADQDDAPPYGRRLGVDAAEIAMVHTTAGTSGKGQEIHALTWRDVEAAGHLSSFAFRWAGLRFGEPAAFNIGFSNSSGGNAMLRGIQAIGRTPVLVAQASFPERLRLLAEFRPVGIYGTPSALNGLARTAAETGFDVGAELPELRFLLTSAEPFPTEWAERMEDVWGAPLHEDYGATQSASSICASTCGSCVVDGARAAMHLFEWSFLFEILDPETADPVGEGEWGELYITTLDKQASPLLRFRTRDRVRSLGCGRCACGRELLSIESGTITRYDDMLKIKGQNVWPADMESLLFGLDAVAEFSGEIAIGPKGRDELYLRVAPARAGDDALAEAIRASFKARFNITPQVELVPIAELPEWNTPERKSRRFVDTRQAGLTA